MHELALHIMDIMQNSITAQSSQINVKINADGNGNLVLTVGDDGCGMDAETLKKAEDPFYAARGTRMVGLGIPMLKEAALQTGGSFLLNSEETVGTELTAVFVINSIDRQPLGNVGNVFFLTLLSYGSLKLTLELNSAAGTYIFSSEAFVSQCVKEGKSAMDAAFRSEALINQQVEYIFKGVLPEVGR